MPREILIIGCGYVGLPLALELQSRGDDVTGWVRSENSAADLHQQGLAQVVTGSVADADCWRHLTRKFDAVIHCASSGGGGPDAYREVFLEGVRRLNEFQAQARRLLVSSTSVYGQVNGEAVDESSATEPAPETSRVLRETEAVALQAGGLVVRAAGIYGPTRAVLFEKFRRGEAVIEGDGTRWINQIHRHDLVAALVHLLEAGTAGEIYNAADDEPVMLRDYYAWCAAALHLPLPPQGPVNLQRKRGLTNKRVVNRKLRLTGWSLRYPSFREGLSDLIM